MPIAVYVPSKLSEGHFTDLPIPGAGDNGKAITWNNATGAFVYTAPVAPGGSTTQVQYYGSGGAFAGDAGMTYNAATDRLTVAGGLVAPSMRPASNSTSALGWFDASGTQWLYGDTTNLRLGVGTTPSYKIDVLYTSGVNGAAAIRVKNTLTAGNATAEFRAENDANYSARMFKLGTSYAGYKTLAANDIGFYNDMNAGNIVIINDCASGKVLLSAGGQSNAAIAIQSNNFVGIGQDAATALLDLAASTTARASLRIRAGTAPTTPNAGDVWYPSGGRLSLYRAATEIFATGVQGAGGAATATGTWGATEQAMLQAIYDAGRAFGLLS